MSANPATRFGDFTVFGFTQKPDLVRHKLSNKLGIAPRVIELGSRGRLFLYTSCGDVAETETAIALKLGFVRSSPTTPLSAQQLLNQGTVSPHKISHTELRGNAIVACFSQVEPTFSVYQTLLALPQLYYHVSDKEILCADNLRCLIALLERKQLNEEAIPMHFLFNCVPGHLTYFRDVQRLRPGHLLKWRAGHLTHSHVRDLHFDHDGPIFNRIDAASVSALGERMQEVIGAYLSDVAKSCHKAANLLSGGVDSSIIQLLLNEQPSASARPKSFSYAVQTPGFEFEIEYARQASLALQTDHTFVDILPQNLPDLLIKAIELVARPPFSEAEPCKLALAEFLSSNTDCPDFVFVGIGSDQLFGLANARKLAILDLCRKIPGSCLALRAVASLLGPRSSKAHGLSEIADWLSEMDAPCSFKLPPLTAAAEQDLGIACRSFGPDVLKRALEFRRSLQVQYLDSPHLIERFQVLELMINAYEPAVFGSQLFQANKIHQIYPYLDEDIIRMAFAFAPNVRYVTPKLGLLSRYSIKPLPRQILRQKSFSTFTRKRKGGSVFPSDLCDMMRQGALRQMVQSITRPAFLSKADFDKLVEKPGRFSWNLLTFDTFCKTILQT
jgi:asparagine synthetase B (glutamine-hydrolysing)